MPVLEWDRDRGEICERIKTGARLKLCVKTIDSPELIEGWIEHHRKIVGPKNLIIADNGSTSQKVLDIYEMNLDQVTIFRFPGPHNQIHWHPRFSLLFEAVRASCSYFMFADADERLVRMTENSWVADASVVCSLPAEDTSCIIPTTWLINKMKSFTRFSILDTEGRPRLKNNLKWGKPILPANLVGSRHGIHNCQFEGETYSSACGTNLILLHLTQFPEHRIAINRNKLISNGFVDDGLTDEEIMCLKLDNSIAMRFIVEMREMSELIAEGMEDTTEFEKDYIELRDSGAIFYSGLDVRDTFQDFLRAGSDLIAEVLQK